MQQSLVLDLLTYIDQVGLVLARRRSSGIFLEDVACLKKIVEKATKLPAVFRDFVERGNHEVKEPVIQSYRGLSSSEGDQVPPQQVVFAQSPVWRHGAEHQPLIS